MGYIGPRLDQYQFIIFKLGLLLPSLNEEGVVRL